MLYMLDEELGAFLYAFPKEKKIRGFLYRQDEKKNLLIMGVEGSWQPVIELDDPFLRNLGRFLTMRGREDGPDKDINVFMGDREKIHYVVLADFLAERGGGELYSTPEMDKMEEHGHWLLGLWNSAKEGQNAVEIICKELDTFDFVSEAE